MSLELQITRVVSDDELIKIYGVRDIKTWNAIRSILHGYATKLTVMPHIPDLIPGKKVIAVRNSQYCRAQIININNDDTVSVMFIDYGDLGVVSTNVIRRIEDVDHLNWSTFDKPLVVEYILVGAFKCRPWNSTDLSFIHSITQSPVEVIFVGKIGIVELVSINIPEIQRSFHDVLIERGFALPVQLSKQEDLIKKKYLTKMQRNRYQIPPPGFSSLTSQSPSVVSNQMPASVFKCPQTQPVLMTPSQICQLHNNLPIYTRMRKPDVEKTLVPKQFTFATLPIDSEHEVHISHCIDGMQCFTVQLKKVVEETLQPLMVAINDRHQELFTDPIQPGTACLGRYSEDNSICRAVVSTVVGESANLYFVDFGNSELVPLNEIYKIPPAFMEIPCVSIRFTLAGASCPSLSSPEATSIFIDIVSNAEVLKMRVMKPEKPQLQFCDLLLPFDGKFIDIKKKVMDKMKVMKPVAYQYLPFKQGHTTDIVVSYVESAYRFFAQIELNGPILEALMKSIEDYCTQSENKEILYIEDVNENMAVCAQYSEDGQWYRAKVFGEAEGDLVPIFFVDYGNQELTHLTKLRVMNNEMISKFPVQAIECRIDIDANIALRRDVIDYFVDRVDGNTFKMKVLNVLPTHVLLVELFTLNEESITAELVQKFLSKETSPSCEISVRSHSSAGNWRVRKESPPVGHNFSAFRKPDESEQLRCDADIDETDNIRSIWNSERSPGKLDRNDSQYAEKRVLNRKDLYEDRSYKPLEDSRSNRNDNDWRQSDNRGSKSFNRSVSGDNVRPFKQRGDRDDKNWSNSDAVDNCFKRRNSRDVRIHSYAVQRSFKVQDNWSSNNSGGRPYKPRDRDESNWSSNANSGDSGKQIVDRGKRPYKSREDRCYSQDSAREGSKSWMVHDDRGSRDIYGSNDQKNGWNSGMKDDSRDLKKYDDRTENWNCEKKGNSCNSRNNNAWNLNKNKDSWNSRRNDDCNSNKKGECNLNKNDNPAHIWNDGKDGDTCSLNKDSNSQGSYNRNNRFSKWDGDNRVSRRESGSKQRSHGYRSQNKWGDGGNFGVLTKTLVPAYEKGSKFMVKDYAPGEELPVVVSWFINPAQFYVIPAVNEEFTHLMETIQSDYPDRQPVDLNSLSRGDCLVAQDKDDGIYRAKFIHSRPGGAVVSFVDYGNSATIKKDHAWIISQDHCALSIQAICCSLYNISTIDVNTPWSNIEGLEDYFGRDKYTLTFVEFHEEPFKTWSVKLTNDENQDVGDLLIAAGLAESPRVLKSEHLYDADLLRHQILTVFSGSVVSSKKFFVHVEPEKANKIGEKIAELCEKRKLLPLPTDEIVAGEFCLACSDDEQYYRALIVSVDETKQIAQIEYIDYGDENEVSFDAIKILPNELLIYDSQVKECCLYEGESFENEDAFLEAVLEKDLIMSVIDVVNDKLHVILYDVDGNRLPYPHEVEGDKVPVLCPLPILKCTDNVIVSHIEADKVYIQKVIDKTFIEELSDSLATMYESRELEKVILESGRYYAAKSGIFERWYRCKASGSGLQEVYYIDYGNSEALESVQALKPLDNTFFAHPTFCIGVKTSIQFIAEDLIPLVNAVRETVFNATFKYIEYSNEWYAELKCEQTGKTIVQFAIETNCGVEITYDKPESPTYDAFKNWSLNEEREVRSSYVRTPENFYIQSVDDLSKIERLQEKLQCNMKRVLPLLGEYDEMMAAQNPEDKKFYRVRGITKNEVLAIDYGFTLTDPVVKKLPRIFLLDKSNYVTSCSLDVQPTGDAWSQETILRFSDIAKKGTKLTAKLKYVKYNKKYVDLIVDGISCKELLISESLAVCKIHGVTITHVTSVKEFYVQFSELENHIYNMLYMLLKAEKWESIEPKLDELVAARFVTDDQWYRAKIIRIEGDEVHVKFIDYGNESVCTQFRKLPDEIQSPGPYAVQCSLQLSLENVEENKRFVEFVAGNEGSYSVKVLEGMDPYFVILQFNWLSIDEILSRMVETKTVEVDDCVVISHINSPSSFYVQREAANVPELNTIGDTAPLTEFIIGDLVAAKFPDDGLWYRAKIIDDTGPTVVFIDYGNEGVVHELRALPDKVLNIPFMAKHCAFPCPAEKWPDVANVRFSELASDGKAVFTMEIIKVGDPAVVDLNDHGMNVADELVTLCKADLTAPVQGMSKQIVVISYVNSVTSLWIQFQTPQVDEMIKEMECADTFDNLTVAEVGDLVAAQFEGTWFRATVVKDLGNRLYKVQFIDYGNDTETGSLKSLPEDLKILTPLAKRCKLKGVSADADVMGKLLEMMNDAVTLVVDELREVDDSYVVSLNYANGEGNVSKVLMKHREVETESDLNENITSLVESENEAELGEFMESAEVLHNKGSKLCAMRSNVAVTLIEDKKNAMTTTKLGNIDTEKFEVEVGLVENEEKTDVIEVCPSPELESQATKTLETAMKPSNECKSYGPPVTEMPATAVKPSNECENKCELATVSNDFGEEYCTMNSKKPFSEKSVTKGASKDEPIKQMGEVSVVDNTPENLSITKEILRKSFDEDVDGTSTFNTDSIFKSNEERESQNGSIPEEETSEDENEVMTSSAKMFQDFFIHYGSDSSYKLPLNCSFEEITIEPVEINSAIKTFMDYWKTEPADCNETLSGNMKPLIEGELLVAHIDNPSSFFLHSKSNIEGLHAAEEMMKEIDVNTCKIACPEVGQIMAANVNNKWRRVKVLESNALSAKIVKCLDYGDVILCDTLCSLPENLLALPPLVHHCAFRLPENLTNWPKNVCMEFKKMLDDNPSVRVEVLEEVDDVKFVNLVNNDENITTKIMSMCSVSSGTQD